MYDTPEPDHHKVLSRDPACPDCPHSYHIFLACSDDCDCPPHLMPGAPI